MKKIQATLATFVISVFLAVPAIAETIHGKVVGISDGDTVTILDSAKTQYKIRLSGIDAPEKSPPFWNRSKEHLSALVFAKNIEVDWVKKDKYGRTIGKVIVNGRDANLEQLRAGLAWHYKAYQKEQRASERAQYADAETAARAKHVGLWHDPKPVAPWDFRHGARDANPTHWLKRECRAHAVDRASVRG
jgi:endonuclease YncB( thermonuclease family)